MQAEKQNYGVAEGPGTEGSGTALGTRDERTWSVLSHLSIFLNLFTGFLGPVASLIVYRDRSQTVAFQALQSAIYQGAWLVILVAGWTITGLLTFILVGFLLVPGMAGSLRVPLLARRLRGLQGEPGRKLPVSVRRRPDRKPLEDTHRRESPSLFRLCPAWMASRRPADS